MKRLRAYKTELNPNNVQRSRFRQHAGVARFVYNWALADRKHIYETTGKSGSMYEQKRRFNALKAEQFPWIYESASRTAEEAFRHLDAAYGNFFRRIKKGETPGFPKFKSRFRSPKKFTMRGCIHITGKAIKLPRIGWVRMKECGYLPIDESDYVRILSVNISERAGRWFASVQTEEEVSEPEPAQGPPMGVDLGIKALAVCSDGTRFENPKALGREGRKLARLNRELSRRKKGSKNRDKTKHKLQRCYARIANIRKHAQHQASYYVTAKANPSTVVVEDLNVAGMMKNHTLAKAIGDASMSELRRQIAYKAEWNGVQVMTAGRWYASTQLCSECGQRVEKTLSDRIHACPHCGLVLDRDYNAALNLASLVSENGEGPNRPGLPVELGRGTDASL